MCPLDQFRLGNHGQRNCVAWPVRRVFWQSEVHFERRFEFKEGSSNKFWEVTLSDKTLTVRFGRVGSKGQEKSTTFPRSELAQKEHDKLIAEKLRKGYKEVAATDAGQSGPSASTLAGKSKSPGDILSAVKQCEPLKRVAAQLNSLQRLSLRITTAPAKETGVGISKLGGRPDLPAGISWPIGKVAGRDASCNAH